MESLSFFAEAFVFVYIGITGFGYNDQNWSLKFIILEILIITVGRFIGIVGLLYLVSWVFNHQRELTFKQSIFLYVGGLIWGAIAFGLVLWLDPVLPNWSVIVTTSYIVVAFTTVFYGTMVPILSNFMLAVPKSLQMEHQDSLSPVKSWWLEIREESSESSHEFIEHPNLLI